MKRICVRKSQQATSVAPVQSCEEMENNKKVDSFLNELKQKLDTMNDKTDEVIDNVVNPVAKLVLSDVMPIMENACALLSEEPPHQIITKQTLRINEIEEFEPEIVDMKEEQLSEVNTIELNDTIVANEDCILKISPIAKLPIAHILSANVIFANPCDGVSHEIIESDDKCSFLLYVKNNRNEDLNVKICYNVLFDKVTETSC
jgi:hypothetical protein